MMVIMRAGSSGILIRMSPLTVTSELRMRVAPVWEVPIDNVAGRAGLDHGGRHPGRATKSSLVLTLLLARIVVLSVVGYGEVTIVGGEGPRGRERGTISAE
jgi:hypothetical protein